MTADLLALLESDPAAGILAAADLREQRAESEEVYGPAWLTVGSEWIVVDSGACNCGSSGLDQLPHEQYCSLEPMLRTNSPAEAEHIAAEANPVHAFAAVRRWRGVVERHRMIDSLVPPSCSWCSYEEHELLAVWPCIDLLETADEARAYCSGGTS